MIAHHQYKPKDKVSPFALTFNEDVHICVYKLDFDANLLYEFLMNEETYVDDNLFLTYSGHHLIDPIRNQLLTNISHYVKMTHTMVEKNLLLKCWCNVIREGEHIEEHSHNLGPYAYLSSQIFVKGYDDNTTTKFTITNSKEELYVKDNSGELIIFPAWLPHGTSVYKGQQPRIVLGVDILPKRFYDEIENKDSFYSH